MCRFVTLVTDSGFFTPLAFALGFALAFRIVGLAFTFRLALSLGASQAPSTSMGTWSAASAQRRSTTSALICAQEFSLAESLITCFCNSSALILKSSSLIAVTGSVGRIDQLMVISESTLNFASLPTCADGANGWSAMRA